MTKHECRSLAEVRDHIDRIDRKLVELMAERNRYVSQAARLKTQRREVIDRVRVEGIIARVRALSAEFGLETDIAEQVFRTMIDGFITFEYEEFDRIHGELSGEKPG